MYPAAHCKPVSAANEPQTGGHFLQDVNGGRYQDVWEWGAGGSWIVVRDNLED